ncbi:calcium-binding protein [Azospirillum sp. B21]|uniref:PD40 domain-containing protein n=1 Tax=Azospirillum sp. B21 TaxID=2607496 RepID=UPI0011EE4DCC|nr:PD40 domain-containing protein [Azospirillum sp. B21]KAA0583491.1 calcium-binding protein [Azospirillum sp. B21]
MPATTPAIDIELASSDAEGVGGNSNSSAPVISADGTKVVFQSSASDLVPGDTNGQYDLFLKDLTTGAITRVNTAADGTVAQGTFFRYTLSSDGTTVAFASDAEFLVPNDTNGTFDVFVKDMVTGQVTLVSQTAGGVSANGFSTSPALSADGRIVAFESRADDLVPGDTNGQGDIFVKDLSTGAVTLASLTADGAQTNDFSASPKLSADGSKLVFTSAATNLVPGDVNGEMDTFLKDLTTGQVTLVSQSADGTQPNRLSGGMGLSDDGSKVVFVTAADNLVPNELNDTDDVFLKDLATGTLTLVSQTAAGVQSNGWSGDGDVSGDGTKVVFVSSATNLVPDDTNGLPDVFMKDLTSGEITLVSLSPDGLTGSGANWGDAATLSSDGSRIAFTSAAPDLSPDDANGPLLDVFVATLGTEPEPGRKIRGTRRADTLTGGDGDDTLCGWSGNDLLAGGAGDDLLFGGRGKDTLTGGEGADLFVTGRGGGRDLVTDFDFAEGDRIGLAGSLHWRVRSNVSGDAVVDVRGSGSLTLAGIAADEVTSAWFTAV